MTVGCSIPWERVFQRGNAQHNESVLRECVSSISGECSVCRRCSAFERLSMGLRVWCACVWCLEVMSNDDLESDLDKQRRAGEASKARPPRLGPDVIRPIEQNLLAICDSGTVQRSVTCDKNAGVRGRHRDANSQSQPCGPRRALRQGDRRRRRCAFPRTAHAQRRPTNLTPSFFFFT